jgi:hypothetical protein
VRPREASWRCCSGRRQMGASGTRIVCSTGRVRVGPGKELPLWSGSSH